MPNLDPRAAAAEIYLAKYPAANVLLLAGSVVRGEATEFSDLDLVVVFESLPNAYRESFVWKEWPVEAFVNDLGTLQYFFEKVDGASGRPALPQMVLEGIEISPPHPTTAKIKKLAQDLIERGPAPLEAAEIERMRYGICDLVDDLRGSPAYAETVATATQLYPELANAFFRLNGLWSASRKTIPRRLRAVSPVMAANFECAFGRLFRDGDASAVISLCEQVLRPWGGFLFDGYRLEAPAAWRIRPAP